MAYPPFMRSTARRVPTVARLVRRLLRCVVKWILSRKPAPITLRPSSRPPDGSPTMPTSWIPRLRQIPNVVTNVMLERMAASDGPTAGRILRPSDGKEPHTVAFVQCAGSRDENHLPYCSGSLLHGFHQACRLHTGAVSRDRHQRFSISTSGLPGKLEEFYAKVNTSQSANGQRQGRAGGRESRHAAICWLRPKTSGGPEEHRISNWWFWPPEWCLDRGSSDRSFRATNSDF